MDYLLREESPLTEREWAEVDEVVSRVIAAQIVGRRFLSLFGPMGPGVQVVPIDRSPNFEIGGVDMIGQSNDAVTLSNRIYQKVPMLHRDFILVWRDLETSRTQGTP
ncbi:MAG TPA: bacteriocin, partial [Sulfobacillus sp.]|nr:bacteriocin [Sulfobacillus sp.]